MNVDLAQELLNELGSSLEKLETQFSALSQFLKDNGTLTDDQFAPYLAAADKASSVRWRAAHIRLESLFRSEREREEKSREELQKRNGAETSSPQNREPREAEDDAPSASAKEKEINGEVGTSGDQSISPKEDIQDSALPKK